MRLFGSRARGQARPDADADLLLYSHGEVAARRACDQAITSVAWREGILLDG